MISSGKFNFVIISPYFAIFKNVAHSLEPSETPSDMTQALVTVRVCHIYNSTASNIFIFFHDMVLFTITSSQMTSF